MKPTLNPSALYWATFNNFELRLPGEAILDIAQSGANDAAVEYWTPKVRDLNAAVRFNPTPDEIRKELAEFGSWDDEELADDAENWNRIVWLAAHHVAEEDEPDCSAPVPRP